MEEKKYDKTEQIKAMTELFAKIDDPKDFEDLLVDLCTYQEVEQMAQRLNSAYLIFCEKTYTQVMREVEISSATLSRVSRCVSHGSGGYSRAFKKYGYEIDND